MSVSLYMDQINSTNNKIIHVYCVSSIRQQRIATDIPALIQLR